MNFKEIILPVALILLAVVALVALITGLTVWGMSHECAGSGGTFTMEGTVAWCRH